MHEADVAWKVAALYGGTKVTSSEESSSVELVTVPTRNAESNKGHGPAAAERRVPTKNSPEGAERSVKTKGAGSRHRPSEGSRGRDDMTMETLSSDIGSEGTGAWSWMMFARGLARERGHDDVDEVV